MGIPRNLPPFLFEMQHRLLPCPIKTSAPEYCDGTGTRGGVTRIASIARSRRPNDWVDVVGGEQCLSMRNADLRGRGRRFNDCIAFAADRERRIRNYRMLCDQATQEVTQRGEVLLAGGETVFLVRLVMYWSTSLGAMWDELECALFGRGEKLIDGMAVGAVRVLIADGPVKYFFFGARRSSAPGIISYSIFEGQRLPGRT